MSARSQSKQRYCAAAILKKSRVGEIVSCLMIACLSCHSYALIIILHHIVPLHTISPMLSTQHIISHRTTPSYHKGVPSRGSISSSRCSCHSIQHQHIILSSHIRSSCHVIPPSFLSSSTIRSCLRTRCFLCGCLLAHKIALEWMHKGSAASAERHCVFVRTENSLRFRIALVHAYKSHCASYARS